MLCPVCKTECYEKSICTECGFEHLRTDFLNADEVNRWYTEFVFPYMITEFFEDEMDYPVKMCLSTYKKFKNCTIEQIHENHYPLKTGVYYYLKRCGINTFEDMLHFYFRSRSSLCNGRTLTIARFYRTVIDMLLKLEILGEI